RTPLPDRLVTNDHATSQHHLLHLAEAEREAVVEPDTVANDLRREAKPSVRRRLNPHQPSPSHPTASNPGDPPSHKAGDQVDSALPRLPGLNRDYGRAGIPYADPATPAFTRDPGTDTPGTPLPPGTQLPNVIIEWRWQRGASGVPSRTAV